MQQNGTGCLKESRTVVYLTSFFLIMLLAPFGARALDVSPTSLDFGSVPVNTSETLSVTVSNPPQNVEAEIISITVDGDFTQTNDCPSPSAFLFGGQACTVTVTFSPEAAGLRSGQLTIESLFVGDEFPNQDVVDLSGTGTEAEAILSVSPSSLNFGDVPVNTTSSAQPVSVSNTGDAPLTIQQIATTGDFAQTSDCPSAPSALSGGQSCTVQVTFSPQTAGDLDGELTVSTVGAGGATVSLVGTGTGQGTLVANPPSLDLNGVAEQMVEGTVAITGGAPPYQASSTLGATTSLNIGTLTYRYLIPSGASGVLSDTVTVVDSLGATLQVPVRIDVGQSLSVSPSPLELSGASLVNVDNPKKGTLGVSGGQPPYSLAVVSGPGDVAPPTLNAPGEATYTFTIPGNTPASTTFNATIAVTDSLGANLEIPVTIKVGEFNPITGRPDLTPNERNVAKAIEVICPQLNAMGNRTAGQQDLLDQCTDMVSNGTSPAIPATMEAITTEKASASTSVSIEVANQQVANVGARLAALRRGSTGLSVQGLTLNVDGQSLFGSQLAGLSNQALGGGASADSAFGRWGFFINGSLNFGDKNRTDNETGFDFDTAGITAGADYRLTDKFVAGGALGYAKHDVDFDSHGGDLDTDSWTVSGYGTYYLSDRIYIDGILGYGWDDYDSGRNIQYRITPELAPVARRARANYDGKQYGGSLGVGYNIDGPLNLDVYGRANYTKVDVDGFREKGASGLDLSVDDFDAKSFTTTVGGQISRAFSTKKAVLVPQARLEWEHEFENDADALEAQFINDPTGTSFNVLTDSPDRDYFRLGLGLSAVFPRGVSAFINYDTLLGQEEWTNHAIDVGVRWEF